MSIMTNSILLLLLYVIRPALQLESDSFLIYNENHKKCLQAQQNTIKVADCKPDNNAQNFRWISKHQLINVEVATCLGVSSKAEKSLVSLSSCDGASELQKWECKNDTLFGIQGIEFYLSYENTKVILHKETGGWSQWKIYGTPDDLCVKAYEEIYTIDGNGNGQPCVFPFKFSSKWYADCTAVGTKYGDLWCATTSDYTKDELWGYCPVKTTKESWWKTDSITGFKYQVNGKSALTWYQARRSCHQQDAELISITELHEQTYISGLTNSDKTALWMGLNNLEFNAGWKWNDGNPFRYLNWLPGNPSEEHGKNCVSLEPQQNAMWENKECSQKLGYVCKKGNVTSYVSPSDSEPINCPLTWIPYAGYCYFLHKETKNWQDAMVSCRKQEGDLASLHNVQESSFANSNFEFEDAEHVWLGLNDLKTQMFFEWSDGTPVTYTVWQKGEPSHMDNRQEDCVALNTAVGQWTDQSCEKKFPYLCKRKPLPFDPDRGSKVELGCSTGWKRHGIYCYFVGEELSTFSEANSSCNTHAAFLTTVENRFEQAYLTSLIGLRPEKYFWIGLSDTEERGTFKWTTDERVLYSHWDADMPGRKQGCVVMRTANKGGLWDVIICDEKAKFVCKKLAEGVTPPPIPPTTPEPKCPTGWWTNHHLSSCFKYYSRPDGDKKTWSEARDFCKAVGGDLLSINNKEEQDVVFSMTFPYRHLGNKIWIGLISSDPHEGFQWSDGSPLTYESWGYGEPNNYQGVELCGELLLSWRMFWNDLNCEHPGDWICELKKGAPENAEPTSSPYPELIMTTDGWLVKGDRQYYVGNDEVTMEKARDFCKNKYGDLVTINDEEQRKFLWRFILRNGTSTSYYIGLYLSLDKQFRWLDGSPVDYVSWSVHEPNFSNNEENCVVMRRNIGKWNDINCGTPNSYICERKTNNINTTLAPTVPTPRGGCPAEWIAFERKCYKIFGKDEDVLVDWQAGRSACQQLGGNLASIPNDLVQDFITYNIKDLKNSVWIGLNDISSDNKYRWTDQTGVYYTNWAKGYPLSGHYYYDRDSSMNEHEENTDCVAIKMGDNMEAGTWTNEDCQLTKGYICQKSEDPALPVVTTVAPSSDQQKFGNASYKLHKTKMTWDEAQQTCKKSDYHLASILEPYTASFLKVQLHTFKEPFWIGLYSNSQTYWQYKWSDGWKLRYTRWAPNEPKEKNACVYVDTDGQWKTSSCNESYASICKQANEIAPSEPPQKPGKCPEMSKSWIPFRGHCYFLEASESTTWGLASIECLRHGGSIVSIEDQHEAQFVYEHIELLSDKRISFWIGLFRNVEGKWLWMDNTPIDYVNWEKGQPTDHLNYDCVSIHSKKGTWSNDQCFTYQGYICKIPKIPEPAENKTDAFKETQKPTHGIAGGVSILVIVIVGGTAIVVYLVYRKKGNMAPPAGNGISNMLYLSGGQEAETRDTNILVANMEQM